MASQPDPRYREDVRLVLQELLPAQEGVRAGKMFGFPAWYAGRRLFACVYGEGVGLKVPAALAQQLLLESQVIPFRPMGKPPMREWVQLNRAWAEDYRHDLALFLLARDHVLATARP